MQQMQIASPTFPSAGPVAFGLLAAAGLLGVYFAILTLVSGWAFTVTQFADFGYYVVALAAGFGVQVALFVRLRRLLARHATPAVVATTGATSTAAMVSCCAHYLVNVAPVLGATGLVTLAAQYQVELFWVGLAMNAAGIVYIGSKLLRAQRDHAACAPT